MLAAVQFTVAVDFVIMMPLGPQLMRIFGIDTPAFNFAVHPMASDRYLEKRTQNKDSATTE